MKIMTNNPVIVNGNVYSSLDGSSSSEDIKAFQRWVYYVKKDASIATSKVQDGVDGLFGSRTTAAWKKYGDEYTKLVEAAKPKPVTTVETNAPIITETVKNDTDIDEKEESWWKKQSLLNKTLIVGGAFLVFGVIVYTIKKSKKKASVSKK